MKQADPTKKARIVWIDGMRALGILFVFFAHDGLAGGPMLLTVSYTCSVPVFFFAAGLFAGRSAGQPFGRYLSGRCKQLLVPYFVYNIATIFVCGLMDRSVFSRLGGELLNVLLGRRNFLFATATWFLPCLFVLSCLYQLMLRCLPTRWMRLAAAALISLPARLFLEEPMLLFSTNAALRYLFYYALGDALAPMLTTTDAGKHAKILKFSLGGVGSVLFLVMVGGLYDRLHAFALRSVPLLVLLNCLFALSAIAAFAVLGGVLGHLPPVAYAGRNTLVCCGTESMARPLLARLLALFGIGLAPASAPGRIVMNGIVIAFILVLFALPIQRFAPWLAGRKYTPRNKTN